jgi:hypothetical protein
LVLKKDLKEGSLIIEKRIWSKYFEKYWKLKTAQAMITHKNCKRFYICGWKNCNPWIRRVTIREPAENEIYDISHQVFT